LKRFEEKIVLVTGASRGIGKTIATKFASEGAKVCLIDINKEILNTTIEEITDKGFEAKGFVCDVSDSKQVNDVVEKIIKEYKTIDILVNNAGVLRDNLIFKMSDSDWDTVMDVHLKGSFNFARAVQTKMVENKFGRIINTSSSSALGNRGQVNYSTAKAGLQGFTKTLAAELGKFGITTNAVAPGFIETDMTKETAKRIGISFEDMVKGSIRRIPVGRSGKPEDVANAVMFYAMEDSSFINGQILYVAGGPVD